MKLYMSKFIMLCALSATVCSSCISDFESINTNPLRPNKEDQLMDGVAFGALFPNMQKTVIPIGTTADKTVPPNKYQNWISMGGDNWIGYMGARESKWDGGLNFTNYFFPDVKLSYIFDNMMTDVYAPWMDIKRLLADEDLETSEIFALAQIIKVAAVHQATDTFGPLPYSKVGSGSFSVAYDSQKDIYTSFFAELEAAIGVLTHYSINATHLVEDYDVVYEGDVNKWIRFANSLMLRLAIRVKYADSALSQKYAEMAMSHSKGLITSEDQAAKMGSGAGLQMVNPLFIIDDSYDDVRMGATIWCYMTGYEDPRLSAYFTTIDGEYLAVRSGLPAGTGSKFSTTSRPIISTDDPLYWMRASEVLFLKAEAALAGYSTGGQTAQELYEAGVKMSFSERQLSSQATAYLQKTTKPKSYIDANDASMGATPPSTIDIPWNEDANDELNLERIITQKYIAIFPNGQEAWSEWRRTGYPKQVVVYENKSNSGVITGDGHREGGVRRLSFPLKEYQENTENVQAAITNDLGGLDKGSTNVWWDQKD